MMESKLEIILYSRAFWPLLGGIETITDTLATHIVKHGHDCTVITETPLEEREEIKKDYKIVRQPTLLERCKLVARCSLVHSNGASVALFPIAKVCKKPFIWTHNGYQVSYYDGLGIDEKGNIVPITPLNFIKHHLSKNGFLYMLKECIKIPLRAYVSNLVDANVACTKWVAKRQPLKNQVVIYNPFPLDEFKSVESSSHIKYDFIFVGRLVFEKGINILLHALFKLVSEDEFKNIRLAIIGDGPLKSDLESTAENLNLKNNSYFLGAKNRNELISILSQARIGVVPSLYEEPMGGVALEFLAAGKSVIVSEYGGLSECIGDAGLTFKNGNIEELYKCMKALTNNISLEKKLMKHAPTRLEIFNESNLTKQYIDLYKYVIKEATKPLKS